MSAIEKSIVSNLEGELDTIDYGEPGLNTLFKSLDSETKKKILANSEGCRLKPKTIIHLLAPLASEPKAKTKTTSQENNQTNKTTVPPFYWRLKL
jgi:hypothetical protein